MKIPRYWAKGRSSSEIAPRNPATGEPVDGFSCWGWSDISREEAEKKGRERADKVVAFLQRGKPLERYLYGDSPLREELVDEWKRDDEINRVVEFHDQITQAQSTLALA